MIPYAKKKASVSAVTPNQAAIKNGMRKPTVLPMVEKKVVVIVSRTKGRELIFCHRQSKGNNFIGILITKSRFYTLKS